MNVWVAIIIYFVVGVLCYTWGYSERRQKQHRQRLEGIRPGYNPKPEGLQKPPPPPAPPKLENPGPPPPIRVIRKGQICESKEQKGGVNKPPTTPPPSRPLPSGQGRIISVEEAYIRGYIDGTSGTGPKWL